MRPVTVCGLGLICPLGSSVAEIFDALCEGRDALGAGPWPHRGWRVCAFSERRSAAELAVEACRQAVGTRSLPLDTLVTCGTTAADLATGEASWREDRAGAPVDPASYLRPQLPDAPARAVAAALGLRGPCLGVSTACTAGAVAVGLAADQVGSGRAEAALAVGVDVLSQTTWAGFGALGLQAEGRCRPFDQDRAGLNLGEAAAALLLLSEAAARRSGAPILAWIQGFGHRADAWHPTAPHPQGRGLQAAIRVAMGRRPPPGWILAHGTGTPANDAAEAAALLATLPDVPVSGVKGSLGHTLGAAGAVEAVIAAQSLQEQRIPPTVGLERPAFELDLVRETREAPLSAALSVNLAFGGSNTALLLGRAP